MENRDKGSTWFWVVGVAALVVIVLVAGSYIYVFSTHVIADQEKWGQFGDFFGGMLNPLLSFLSFTVLLYTVSIQLKLAKKVEDDHEEKVFDDRLFQLLAVNNSLGATVFVRATNDPQARDLHGAVALGYVWHALSTGGLTNIFRGDYSDNRFRTVLAAFRSEKQKFWPSISSYYDSCEFIIEFIATYTPDNTFSEFALRALKSQMTVRARAFLFYVLLNSEKNCRYIPVLAKFGFWDDATEDPLAQYRPELWIAAAAFHQA